MRRQIRLPINRALFLLVSMLVIASIACQAVYQLGQRPLLPAPTGEPSKPAGSSTVTPGDDAPLTEQPPASTSMDKGLQKRVFEDLWKTVKDIYLYPDFHGLDWEAIHVEYSDKIDAGMTAEEFYTAMKEMIDRLGDNHSVFYTPEETKANNEELAGTYNYVGIGVMLSASPDGSRAVILFVFAGSPAEKAGLKARDSILSANGESIIDDQGGIKTIIRGPEGTDVTIELQSPGEAPRMVTITRSAINSDISIPHSILTTPNGKRIGYMFLFTFYNANLPDLVSATLEDLNAEGTLDGLIIDVRENGGGSIAALTDVLALFTHGEVGSFYNRNRDNPLDVGRGTDIGGSQEYPLVILIGKGSYSAGELFPGILQDLGRAYLIGETTNGVVESKTVVTFEDGSQAEISSEAFRPLNHPDTTWQDVGVKPDLEVANAWDQYSLESEPAIIAALDHFDTRK